MATKRWKPRLILDVTISLEIEKGFSAQLYSKQTYLPGTIVPTKAELKSLARSLPAIQEFLAHLREPATAPEREP